MTNPYAPEPLRWEKPLTPIGEGDHPQSRLLGIIQIGKTLFHAEAIQVTHDEKTGEQISVCPIEECNWIALCEADEGVFSTIEIDERQYALLITPFEG